MTTPDATPTPSEPDVIYCTQRNGDEGEIHLECRMSDGQKGAFVVVDDAFPLLANRISALLNGELSALQAQRPQSMPGDRGRLTYDKATRTIKREDGSVALQLGDGDADMFAEEQRAAPSGEWVSDRMVSEAATIIAQSPLIDAPKLPPAQWEGLARHVLEVALSASPPAERAAQEPVAWRQIGEEASAKFDAAYYGSRQVSWADLATQMASAIRHMLASPHGQDAADDAEHLRRQIGYIATELMVRGDTRSLPEIVETAAKATAELAKPLRKP